MSSYLKALIVIILFYLLTLLQTSFFVHFTVWGLVPNLVLLAVILWNLFEDSKSPLGVFSALIGGFYLDVFSNRFFGFNVLVLLIIALVIKLVIKRHVRIPFIEKT